MNARMGDFAGLAEALARQAAALARARAVARRAGDSRWRSARLLWPRFTTES